MNSTQGAKSESKPDRKKMVVIGSTYTIGDYVHMPEQMLLALFQDKQTQR